MSLSNNERQMLSTLTDGDRVYATFRRLVPTRWVSTWRKLYKRGFVRYLPRVGYYHITPQGRAALGAS